MGCPPGTTLWATDRQRPLQPLVLWHTSDEHWLAAFKAWNDDPPQQPNAGEKRVDITGTGYINTDP